MCSREKRGLAFANTPMKLIGPNLDLALIGPVKKRGSLTKDHHTHTHDCPKVENGFSVKKGGGALSAKQDKKSYDRNLTRRCVATYYWAAFLLKRQFINGNGSQLSLLCDLPFSFLYSFF